MKSPTLVVGGHSQLIHLFVHIPQQAVVLLGERNLGIQILGDRSTNPEQAVLIVRLFDVGDDPDLLFEIVQLHQLGLQIGYLGGKILYLPTLPLDLISLQRQAGLVVDGTDRTGLQVIVVIAHDAHGDKAGNDEDT